LKYSEGTPAFSARCCANAVLRFANSRTIRELVIAGAGSATPSRSAWKLVPVPLAEEIHEEEAASG
jgi:hypothetical protein